jgi:hypothetical protein
MLCPVCNLRKAKRACPALGKSICAVCCGTKRLVEIACPHDCGYLASSRTHPPAVVQRQLETDRGLLLPLMQGFTERQARLFLLLGAAAARHRGELLQAPVDEDLAQAAGALAGTLETAVKGIVYEHQPSSLPASRLMAELKSAVAELAASAGGTIDRDAALALRRIEQGARSTAKQGGHSTAFLQLLGRLLAGPGGNADSNRQEAADREEGPGPSLIIP